jgi:hypothetical protein
MTFGGNVSMRCMARVKKEALGKFRRKTKKRGKLNKMIYELCVVRNLNFWKGNSSELVMSSVGEL